MKAIVILAAVVIAPLAAGAEPPLALHPDNPHYFLFRGQPTFLITSAEHYGAVLNADLDYLKYLDELAAHRLNNTRIFSGAYLEPQGAFQIAKNTLAPKGERFLAPWARSDQPGYALGGAKFDLTKWDEAYFRRLKDFVAEAGKRGIVVELALFCPMYEEMQWKLSPLNVANNVNELGKCGKHEVFTLDKHSGLLPIQEALVRKIVTELAEFDNLYYEVCNEPYFGGVTMPWQHRIVDVIAETERKLPAKHLISMNIANGSQKIAEPHPGVAIFNFHYANPPQAVTENYRLDKVIGENETGFKGNGDAHYRMEAWEFLLAGGGLFNNLDYSFAVGHEDGTFEYPDKQPGGGNRGLRKQMRVLREFLESFDFVKMKPDVSILRSPLPAGAHFYALVESGRQVAIYLHGARPAELRLKLSAGSYRAEWINVLTGEVLRREELKVADGDAVLSTPEYKDEVALRIPGTRIGP